MTTVPAGKITDGALRRLTSARSGTTATIVRVAATVAGLMIASAACGSTPSPDDHTTSPSPSATPIAPMVMVPPGNRLALTMTVQHGSQVYACTRGAWSLIAPAAVLTAPTTDALHTAGPRWIATADGSSVTAAQIAASPVPGAIPELLLRATGHDGPGVFDSVDYIQRLATQGGQAPAGPCPDGRRQAEDYTAEYRFYVASP